MVNVHIEAADACMFLMQRGWQVDYINDQPTNTAMYVLPGCKRRSDGGRFGEDFYWDLGEAVQTEIEAIASHGRP